MNTERRGGFRKPLEVDVVIDNQPTSLVRGQIGDVSVGGLFVRTEPRQLAMNSHVELVLMLQHKDGAQVYRMPAIVVRLTPTGAGLMFDEYDVNAFRTLVVLLLNRQKADSELRYRPARRSPSIEDGFATASLSEGAIGKAAGAAPIAPVSSQPSPVLGESH